MQSHASRYARALLACALAAGALAPSAAWAGSPPSTTLAYAWGAGSSGSLGTGAVAHALEPVPVRLPGEIVDIAVGSTSSYAVGADGSVSSWGANDDGRLGDGTIADSLSPVRIAFPGPAHIVDLDVTGDHILALAKDGAVWAWGRNHRGQLGLADTSDRSAPARVTLPRPAVAIAAGRDHSLALLDDGSVVAWGENAVGQLGTGSLDASPAPTVALPAGSRATAIAAGDAFGAALLDDGTVRVWGEGRITGGTATPTAADVAHVAGIVAIAAGSSHLLALTRAGEILAWGSDEHGQLGIPPDPARLEGPASSTTTPVTVGLSHVVAVSAGGGYSLALTSDGHLWSWGADDYGQLGDGAKTDRAQPTAVAALDGAEITAVDAGTTAAFALVDHGPLAQLTLSPANATVTVGTPQHYRVTGTDAFGTDLGTASASLTIDGVPCEELTCTPTTVGVHVVSSTLSPASAAGASGEGIVARASFTTGRAQAVTARAVPSAAFPVVGATRLTAVAADPGGTTGGSGGSGGTGTSGGGGMSGGTGGQGSSASPRGILGLTGAEIGGLGFVGLILVAIGVAAALMGRRRVAAAAADQPHLAQDDHVPHDEGE